MTNTINPDIIHYKQKRKVLEITSKAVEFIIRGTVDWCKLLGPARAYTGDPKFDKGPSWSIEINPDDASRGKLLAHGLQEKFKRDKLTKKDGTPTKNPRDYDFIRLNILETRADGKKNKPPEVQDAHKQPWNQDVELGNGTTVDILVRYVDYGTTQGLYFKKMRVLKLVPYEGGGADFEPLTEEDQYFAEANEWTTEDEALNQQEIADRGPEDGQLPVGMEPELDDDVPE